ncbi:hypothetical protein Tco_1453978, partial [Tanacetum coccineum]
PRVIIYGYDGLPMQPVALPSPDYVPNPEHPLLPVEVLYVPELEYRYVAEFDPDEDPEEDPKGDHADYPVDRGDRDDEPSNDDDDDDDDDTDDEEEEPIEDEDDDKEEEEHLAPADSSAIPVVDPVPSVGDTEAFKTDESAPRLDRLRLGSPLLRDASVGHARLSDLSHLCHHLWRHALLISSPPLPISSPPLPLPPPTIDSPTYAEAPLGYRAAMIRLRPTSLPLPSSPLPPLPASLFIPPPIDRMEDIPKAELLPRKRLCLTALTSRYEVGESLTAAPRPTGGHRVDYGFISTLDAETTRQRAKEVSYGIRDVWVDPREAVEELALTTLEGVNARVTEIAAVLEQDTHDIYAVIEDTQNRQTQLSSTVHYELQAYRAHIQMQDYRIASQESLMTILIAHVSSLQG